MSEMWKNIARPSGISIEIWDKIQTTEWIHKIVKLILTPSEVCIEDVKEGTWKKIIDGFYKYTTFLSLDKHMLTELGFLPGQVIAICSTLKDIDKDKVSLIGLCLTKIPDIHYCDHLQPIGNSNKEKTDSSSTKSSESQRINRFCKCLVPFDLDFKNEFDHFMDQFEQEKVIDSLKIEQNVVKIKHEIQLTTYMSSFVYPFFKRVATYTNHKLCYDPITIVIPDYSINCEDHKCSSIVEIKLDRKFGTNDNSIIEFFNNCNDHKGSGMCKHYVSNSIYQLYCYLANENAQYGMLSTFERSWLCKIEKDKNGVLPVMQITVPYATSTLAADSLYKSIEAHSFFEVTMVLFSLMHKSNELFKSYAFQLPFRLVDWIDDKNNDANIKQNVSLKIPDFSHVNSLDIWSCKQGFLGSGRCGRVFIGAVNGIKVAVKVADLSKMSREMKKEIKEEMRNEAKILNYLNSRHYEHAPKLFYCGYWCGSLFFAIATQLIPGYYKRSREELSDTENKNLDIAIQKLHQLNVTHNDLKWNNVLFSIDEKVFIIDYGFAKFLGKSQISIMDENRYDLD